MPLPIFFGSRIIGQAADVFPDVDLPLHLPLDAWCSSVFPRRLAPSTEAVDAYLRTRAASAPPARPLFRLPLSFGSSVSALDSLTKSPLFRERFLLGQAGEVTLSFRSAVLSSTGVVDAFASLPLPVTSPAERRLAPSFSRISQFGLAENRYPRSAECCRTCSTGDETPAATELRIACHHRGWDFRFPSNLSSCGSRRKANLRLLSNLHLPAWQEMLL